MSVTILPSTVCTHLFTLHHSVTVPFLFIAQLHSSTFSTRSDDRRILIRSLLILLPSAPSSSSLPSSFAINFIFHSLSLHFTPFPDSAHISLVYFTRAPFSHPRSTCSPRRTLTERNYESAPFSHPWLTCWHRRNHTERNYESPVAFTFLATSILMQNHLQSILKSRTWQNFLKAFVCLFSFFLNIYTILLQNYHLQQQHFFFLMNWIPTTYRKLLYGCKNINDKTQRPH